MPWISEAHAQDGAAIGALPPPQVGAAPSPFAQFMPLALIVVVFYFLILRPQQKRLKAHRAMVEGLKRGDKIITAGGIVATVKKVDHESDMLEVEIADNTTVTLVRSTITQVLTRPDATAATTAPDVKKLAKKAANDKK
jgi:preprotein translocase subunit YajC